MDIVPSLLTLHFEKNMKTNINNSIYNIILKKCCEKIKYENNIGKTYVIFEVPSLLPDYPNYNIQECILYLNDVFVKKNYYFYYILPPHHVYIDWGKIDEKIVNKLNLIKNKKLHEIVFINDKKK